MYISRDFSLRTLLRFKYHSSLFWLVQPNLKNIYKAFERTTFVNIATIWDPTQLRLDKGYQSGFSIEPVTQEPVTSVISKCYDCKSDSIDVPVRR